MPITLQPYGRAAAVAYAHRWAYRRNPKFYNYDAIGGDCTNFASQCLYAGGSPMNFTPDFGWYYIDANQKAPAWTGVEYLYRFLTRQQHSVGPAAVETGMDDIMPGDLIQLAFADGQFVHSPVVVAVGHPSDQSQILVAAHTEDSDESPLNTYPYQKARFLHITGIYRP